MPTAKTHAARKEFDRILWSSADLYAAVSPYLQDTYESIHGWTPLHSAQARRVVSMAFLTIWTAWDAFVEGVFLRYMAGAKSDAGYAPTLRIGPCRNMIHACEILNGGASNSRGYLNWTNWKQVKSRANVFFEKGGPFTDISAFAEEGLQDGVIIRNRIAHSSEKCKRDFKKLAQSYLGLKPNDPLPGRYGVGQLLVLKPKPNWKSNSWYDHDTVFLAYVTLLMDLAELLSPAPEPLPRNIDETPSATHDNPSRP